MGSEFTAQVFSVVLPNGQQVYRAVLSGTGGVIITSDKDPAQALLDAATDWRTSRRRLAREAAAKAQPKRNTREDMLRAQSNFPPRQRGCSTDWDALVPAEVAADQRRWERARHAASMRAAGLRTKDIAARMGVSETVAGQLCRKFEWRNSVRRWVSPVERYLGDDGDARKLARAR